MTLAAEPDVTVAMSVRDAGRTIGPALRSLENQMFRNWELVLIDDGSTDDTLAVTKRFRDARIRIIADAQRRGLATRLNQAIELARGRYVARMDADDVSYPQRLERQLRYLEAHPEVHLLGAGMMVFDQHGRAIGTYPAETAHERICRKPYAGFHLAHPSWMGRLEWFRRWRYDPRWIKAQDQELLLRAHRESRFAALPELLLGYRQANISVRKSAVTRWYLSRAIWNAAKRERRRARGTGAISLQLAKLMYDALAVSTGLERVLLRHRALPPSAAQIEQWTQVWAQCAA